MKKYVLSSAKARPCGDIRNGFAYLHNHIHDHSKYENVVHIFIFYFVYDCNVATADPSANMLICCPNSASPS